MQSEEQRLRFGTEAAGIGIWEVLLDTNTVEWDRTCQQLFGLTGDRQIPYEEAIAHIHPEDLSGIDEAVRRALSGVDQGNYDRRYRTIGADDGKLRWVHFKGKAYFNQQGQAIRFGGIAQNITGIMESLAQLNLEKERATAQLTSAVEVAELGTWQLDLNSGDLTCSPRLSRWLGWMHEDSGHIREVLSRIDPSDFPKVEAELKNRRSKEATGIYDLEFRLLPFDNHLARIIRVRGVTRPAAHGKSPFIVGSAQDITFQRDLQLALELQIQERTEELHSSNEELRVSAEELSVTNEELTATNEEFLEMNTALTQSNEDLQQFAHVISHDLKEPIRKIKLFISRILASKIPEMPDRARFDLLRVDKSADRMIAMINSVLAFSQLNGLDTDVVQVDLSVVLQQISEDLDLLFTERQVRLRYARLPTVEGAAVLLYQLFYNLVVNAVKFSSADRLSQINIVSEIIQVKNQEFAKISVRDNGIGFERKYSESIFDTFTRLHSKDAYEGTGLGLALCKKIAVRHGGSIVASGEPGTGAVFVVQLPIKQPAEQI